jgi:hypothetical protein
VLRVPCSKPTEPCAECSEAAKVQTGAPQVDMLCCSTQSLLNIALFLIHVLPL